MAIGLAALAAACSGCTATDNSSGGSPEAPASHPAATAGAADVPAPTTQPASELDFVVKDIAGKDVNLAEKYAGKVVLVVNVASKCGFTPQYAGLEQLHEKYAPKGLAVLGFPCNQFGHQEPGTNEQILQFCQSKFNVKFDMFDKIEVNGEGAAPLYEYLTGDQSPVADKGPVKWNFEKFLFDRNGHLIARYRSKITPQELEKDIEAALAK